MRRQLEGKHEGEEVDIFLSYALSAKNCAVHSLHIV